jgi:hypothetical protein
MRANHVIVVFALAAAACGGASSQSAQSSQPAGTASEKTIFSEVPAFASQSVSATAASAHAAKGAPAPSKETPCLGCHKAGGSASPFAFAGTVYADKDATKGAAGVEVRVADSSGPTASVFTDADGNFWSKGTPLKGPAHAGARNAAKTRLMSQPVTSGDCNFCHAADMPALLTTP